MHCGTYASLGTLRAYLSPDGALGTVQDTLLLDCLRRAEAQIDAYTRRCFAGAAGTAAYSRFEAYRARGPALYLDRDLHTLVSLTNGDGQTIPTGSVWLEPRNEGPPYRVLRLKSAYVWTWDTDGDVLVAGTWGYGTVPPADIVQATVRYAAYLYRQKDVGVSDVSGFEQGGEVQFTTGMPADVRWILAPYRSRTGGAVT